MIFEQKLLEKFNFIKDTTIIQTAKIPYYGIYNSHISLDMSASVPTEEAQKNLIDKVAQSGVRSNRLVIGAV